MKTRASHDLGLSLQLQSQSQSSLLSLWWSRYLWLLLGICVVDVFFVLVECDESRLGILPFFSLPPFCRFCYHCSLSLYFAKYSCTFRSSVLFLFRFIIAVSAIYRWVFVHVSRVLWDAICIEQITNCVPTYYFTCWLTFFFLDLFFV